MPDNPISVAALRKYGVETKNIAKGGEKLGIYFLETGSAMRASSVIYDCTHSAISKADISNFNFDEIFKDAD